MILKQGHNYRAMPHDGKTIWRIYRGGRCYYIASPYSHEATQALRAAFPQYFAAICDYGWANPALVPFINEDPMLIVSLVEVGKTRCITCDGNTKVNLGFPYTNDMELEMDVTPSNINNENCLLTNGNWAARTPLWIIYNGKFRWHIDNSGSLDNTLSLTANTKYVTKVGNGYIEVNGVNTQGSAINYSNNANLIMFGLNASDTTRAFYGQWRSLKVKSASVNKHFVPSIQNGVAGIIDLLSGEFIDKPLAGAFTIEITDKE